MIALHTQRLLPNGGNPTAPGGADLS